MRRDLLVIVILLAGAPLTGCLGDDGASTETGSDREDAADPGCERDTAEGVLTPEEDVSVEVEAGGEPAGAQVVVNATGASQGVVFTLVQAGETLWEQRRSDIGFSEISNTVTGLEAEPVVLAASTDSGTYQVELSLQVAWLGGTC